MQRKSFISMLYEKCYEKFIFESFIDDLFEPFVSKVFGNLTTR